MNDDFYKQEMIYFIFEHSSPEDKILVWGAKIGYTFIQAGFFIVKVYLSISIIL